MTLSDQTAIHITTQLPITLPAPELSYQINNQNFEVPMGSIDNSSLIIENIGEDGSLLTYSVIKSYPDIDAPFDQIGGGPDPYGYFGVIQV